MKKLRPLGLIGFAAIAFGQQQNLAIQREAMKKLEFLTGTWAGNGSVNTGHGEPMNVTLTQDVQWKLGNLVILIESTGRDTGGQAVWQRLATISYDDATSTYHFRAYDEGRYIDTELKVLPKGFNWTLAGGAAHTMQLNEKGEWAETVQVGLGTSPSRTLSETVLHRVSSAKGRFDGQWQTTVSCAAARDALGYSYRFVSTVKEGNLRGVYGVEGEPSSLLIEGPIKPDGTANLYATGHTGSKEFVPGRDAPRGSQYNYSIEAHFDDETGSGTRLEGRPCTLQFQKQ